MTSCTKTIFSIIKALVLSWQLALAMSYLLESCRSKLPDAGAPPTARGESMFEPMACSGNVRTREDSRNIFGVGT